MDNIIHFLYMGLGCIIFCLAVWLLMMSNKEILMILDSLTKIVMDNVMYRNGEISWLFRPAMRKP